MNVIELRNLSFIYQEGMPDQKIALKDINISIERGEFIGIIGHTGSGKSTLIQQINGLLKPSSGEVIINGKNIWESKATLKQSRFDVGLVLQYPEYQLFAETCYEDIAFGPRNKGIPEDQVKLRVYEACGYLGLSTDLLERSPFDLSGGEKRRVAIAGVLAMKPEILVLDEPTAGLDPKGRRDLLNTIETYHKKEGNTVLFVSHSMDDVARYSDRVLVMNEGTVYDFALVDDIFKRVSELKKIGLSIPSTSEIMLELSERGVDVDTSLYTPFDAAQELLKLKRNIK